MTSMVHSPHSRDLFSVFQSNQFNRRLNQAAAEHDAIIGAIAVATPASTRRARRQTVSRCQRTAMASISMTQPGVTRDVTCTVELVGKSSPKTLFLIAP